MSQLCKLWPQIKWIIKNLKLCIIITVLNNSLLYTQVLFKMALPENVCLLEAISRAPITIAAYWGGQYEFFWLVTYTWRLRIFWYLMAMKTIYHSSCDTVKNKRGITSNYAESTNIILDHPGKIRSYSHPIHGHIMPGTSYYF